MPSDRIYAVWPSFEDVREHELVSVRRGGWRGITGFASGERPKEEYVPLDLVVNVPDVHEWDLYRCAGTYGLFSERAIETLSEYFAPRLSLLNVSLNGIQFYFPRVEAELDCLNRAQSKLVMFESGSSDVMKIERYRFRHEAVPDPAFFVIPETRIHLFASQSIPDMIHANGLRGIECVDVESPPSWLNF